MAKFYATDPPRYKDVEVPFRRMLTRLPDDYHVCLEFLIQKDFDVVIVHNRGIHVIEVKNGSQVLAGSPSMARWQATWPNGSISEERNFYQQAVDAADELKNLLQRFSREILQSPCSNRPCTDQQLCGVHRDFWYHCRVFPYVAFANWNPKSRIEHRDELWCWLAQEDDARTDPEHVLDAITRRTWDSYNNMRGTRLTDAEVLNVVRNLPVRAVSQEVALGETPRWAPGLDQRIDRSLRERELKSITEQLKRDPLLAIVGEPKVGKTSTAKLLAKDLNATGLPVLDYDFRLHEPKYGPWSAVMLERFLEQLNIPVRTVQDNIPTFLSALKTNRLCVILDNFESVLDKQLVVNDNGLSRLLDVLLEARPELKSLIIVTTTTTFSTQSSSKVSEFRLGGIDERLALLFLTSAKSYAWSNSQAKRIYDIRAGHPHVMHVASVEIRNSIGLGMTFDEAYEALSPEVVNLSFRVQYSNPTAIEKIVTEIVALHPSGLNVKAIVGIAAAYGRAESVLPVISRLYEKYVLTEPYRGSIRLLPQDQPYVYSQIDNKDKESLHRTAFEWYKRQVGQQIAGDRGNEGALDVNETIFYHALRAKDPAAASHALFDSGLADSFEWTDRLQTLLYLCGQLQERERFESIGARYRGQVCFYLGFIARGLGNLEDAERYQERAEQYFGEAGDSVHQAAALTELGLLNRKKGNFGGGELDFYDYALKLIEGQNSSEAKIVRGRIYGRKGQALQREGADAAEVFSYLNGAVAIARELGDKGVLAARLGTLATAHRELGRRDIPAAIRCCQEALELGEDLQSDPAIVGALRGLGMTYEKSHKPLLALELYLRAFEKTNKADIYGMTDRLSVLAHVYKSLQRFDESEKHYRQALELARQVGNRKAEAENLDELGNLYRQLASREASEGRKKELFAAATEYNEAALQIQLRLEGDPAGLANRHQELGKTLLQQGDVVNAQRHFVSALQQARTAKRQHLEAWQYRSLGDTFKRLGRKADMLLCYMKAIETDSQQRRYLGDRVAEVRRAMDDETRHSFEKRLLSLTDEIEKLLAEL